MFKTIVILGLTAWACAPGACEPVAERTECESDDSGVVQVKWEDTLDCDLTPPQTATVVIDGASYGAGWGGDASLAWADAECADMGGTPVWHNGEWLECQDVDY